MNADPQPCHCYCTATASGCTYSLDNVLCVWCRSENSCPLVQARDNLHPEMEELLLSHGARELKPLSQTLRETCALL